MPADEDLRTKTNSTGDSPASEVREGQGDFQLEHSSIESSSIESSSIESNSIESGAFSSDEISSDTRLLANDNTESIWPGRPPRVSVLRSVVSSREQPNSSGAQAYFRGDGSTSHTRRDLLSGDWTIFAPQRDCRPNEFAEEDAAAALVETPEDSIDPDCPFCRGAEEQTPQAVWSAKLECQSVAPLRRSANSGLGDGTTRFGLPEARIEPHDQTDWDVRVVPNKFPAVSPIQCISQAARDSQPLFPICEIVGGHEVVIESSHHSESMTKVDSSNLYLTLLAYQHRIRYWRQVPGVKYISVFKNCGHEAGASLRHVHSQLIATSLMPQRVQHSIYRMQRHRAETGCTLGCELLRAELDERVRVIDQTDSFVAFCPFASRFAGTIRLTSAHHQPRFEDLSEQSIDQFASFLFRVLSWVQKAFPGRAFNYLLHTCPPSVTHDEVFQWSLDIVPRLSKVAGFEWSSDCMINSLLPEVAARRYRRIARRDDPRNVLSVQQQTESHGFISTSSISLGPRKDSSTSAPQ